MTQQIYDYPEWAVLNRQIALLEDQNWSLPFTIAFCGGFSSGKSSIINAILNCPDDYQLPTGIKPITKIVTHICYGRTLRCSYHVRGRTRTVTGKQASQLIKGAAKLPQGCKEITIELPADILKSGVHFLDTPGFNDEEPGGALEQMSHDAIQRADYVVFCTNSTKCGGEFERDFLAHLHKTKGNFCLIVNRMDSLNTDEDMNAIHTQANWLMNGRGRLGMYGNLNNVFYTVASGRWKMLGGFDSFLTEIISQEGVRRRLRRSTAVQLGNYSAQYLDEIILADFDQAKEAYADILRQHEAALRAAELRAASDVQKVSGEIFDCKNRSEAALEKMYSEYSGMLTSLIAGKTVVSSYPQSFVDSAETGLRQKAEQACKMTEQILISGSQEPAHLAAEGMRAVLGRFEMPEIKPTWVQKRGLLGRAARTIIDSINFELFLPDDGTDPEYRDYHQPILQKVSKTLIPNMRAARDEMLDNYLKSYTDSRMSNITSGWEAALLDAENRLETANGKLNELLKLIKRLTACIKHLAESGHPVNTQEERTVLVTGGFGCGKDTLVNAFIGRKVLYTNVLPQVNSTKIHCSSQAESAVMKYSVRSKDEARHSHTETIDIGHVFERTQEIAINGNVEDLSIELFLNTPITGVAFVPATFCEGIVPDELLSAHAVIYVMNVTHLFSMEDKNNIDRCYLLGRNIFFVINGMDVLLETEIDEVKRMVKKQLKDFFVDEHGQFNEYLFERKVFFTSAYQALCIRNGNPLYLLGMRVSVSPEHLSQTGVPALEESLYWYLNSF